MTREDIHTQLMFYFLDYQVPEWANWVGVDATGEVCVFEAKPDCDRTAWQTGDSSREGSKWDFVRGLNKSNLTGIDDDGFLNFFKIFEDEHVDFWKELLFEL